jgi:primary-amine oxidase
MSRIARDRKDKAELLSRRRLLRLAAGSASLAGGLRATPALGLTGEVTRSNRELGETQGGPPTDPLQPLTADEIVQAVAVVAAGGGFDSDVLYPEIVLLEPPKEEVLRFQSGAPFARRAFIVAFERGANRTTEVVVDVTTGTILSTTPRPGAQVRQLRSDEEIVQRVVKADPRWQAAMTRRGITDWDAVQADTWSPGDLPAPAPPGARLARVIFFYRGKSTNPYARPIEGVVAVVDLNAEQVVEVVDTDPAPLAEPRDLDPASVGAQRQGAATLEVLQPDGPGLRVEGNRAAWDNWRFRFSLHPREGLVLHTLGYVDSGKFRPILYRASLSEMVVPYADPTPTWAWRSAFDVGEYDVGRLANSMTAGVHVPSNAVLVDAVVADEAGDPNEIPGAIALYERDGGVLWQRWDEFSHENQVRRSRELVIHFQTTVGNYDYGLNWILGQDGSIELQAELTGILLAKGVPANADLQGISTPIGNYVAAPNHQHLFNFRLDFDIDGPANSVVEINSRAIPLGPDNPFGNAFAAEETVLQTESEARRETNDASNRMWKVTNPGITNLLGLHPAYMLVPGETAVPYFAPTNGARLRAGFVDHDLWVTSYRPDELYAAGPYPYQGKPGEGLPNWSGNESIQNTDVVVWYTFGLTHVPRPEDWPVMPMERVGFRLLPWGFFTSNPALDVPPPS